MLYPICLGLFLQTRLIAGNYIKDNSSENRTGKYGIFFFAFAVVGGTVIRPTYSLLLEKLGISSNALQAMNLTYFIIGILMLMIGCLIIACLALLIRFNLTEEKQPANFGSLTAVENRTVNNQEKTNWPVILRLFGLAVVFRVLNSIMEMRLFPGYSMNSFALHPIVLIIAIPLLALFAARSINRFLKIFIPAAITIFILLPCLLFFNEYPNFILFMGILVGLLNNLIWVIFTFAIIEHYAGGFWFYALASSIHFTTLFAMVSPMTRQFIPAGTEFTILICGIAAVLFVFLGIRFVFPKIQPVVVNVDTDNAQQTEIFREYKLSDSEAEVAVLVMEGLNNKEIAKRISRAEITVKVHLVSIYKKFDVKNRGEFMAMVMKKQY